ncbi:hypothetical protein [Pseudomonas sp. Z1-6]|uniref:hypothetical protein n=1 Tax=unclassified Pseudomonas TaxID=196821 RepID=UPI003DA9E39B
MRALFPLPLALLFLAPLAQAKEYPIGEPQLCAGLEVGACICNRSKWRPPA